MAPRFPMKCRILHIRCKAEGRKPGIGRQASDFGRQASGSLNRTGRLPEAGIKAQAKQALKRGHFGTWRLD
jgi:hypothetical protein